MKKELEDTKEKSRIAILLTRYYPAVRNFLMSLGYQENVDFVDGWILTPLFDEIYLSNNFEVIKNL